MSSFWYQKQLRILQTVFREIDIINYDAHAVVEYMEQIRANCLVVNGGGIVDFFRHDLPTANPNRFMSKSDILADITTACHAHNITVMVRVDFRGVERHIYEQHPDWFSLDAAGNPIASIRPEMAPSNALYIPCYNSFYRNEHAFNFIDALFQQYDIDGIWENSFSQDGICYCRTCQTLYQQDRGKELPHGGDFLSSTYDEYRKWKEDRANIHLRNAQRAVKKHGDDKAYCAEIFSLYHDRYQQTSLDLYNIRDHFDFLVSPCFTANGQPLSAPSTLIKFLQSMAPQKTPVVLFGHLGSDGGGRMRYVSSPVAETRAWLWETVSAGGSFWDVTFNGHHSGDAPDRRAALLPRDAYAYLEQYEEQLSHQQAVADVDIFYSRDTRDTYLTKGQGNDPFFARLQSTNEGGKPEEQYLSHITGMIQVLRDQHIQYTIRPEYQLTAAGLRNTRVLVLPDVACLSDEQIKVIRQFVHDGGSLLATHLTSLFDQNGIPREDFGLRDVFGCTWTGISKEMSHFGYQAVKHGHPLTSGLDETEFAANTGMNLLVRLLSESNAETPLTYVPRIHPQPPEYGWLPETQTDYATAIVNTYGKGKVIYFPYGIDRNVTTLGHEDFSLILANAYNYLLASKQQIVTNAPVSVYISLNQQPDQPHCYILHLVNYTSAPRRPIPQILPVYDINIESILAGNTIKSFKVLYGDTNIQLVREETQGQQHLKASIHIPRLQEYTGIWIETNA
jgi:hypothetical protein